MVVVPGRTLSCCFASISMRQDHAASAVAAATAPDLLVPYRTPFAFVRCCTAGSPSSVNDALRCALSAIADLSPKRIRFNDDDDDGHGTAAHGGTNPVRSGGRTRIHHRRLQCIPTSGFDELCYRSLRSVLTVDAHRLLLS